jgi:UDP-glucose 6-dehydrogenase
MMCKKMGISEEKVTQAVSLDSRIGSYGTVGGPPFGGACLPKDTEAFASFAKNLDMRHDLIELAIRINKQMDETNSQKVFVKQSHKEHLIEDSEF